MIGRSIRIYSLALCVVALNRALLLEPVGGGGCSGGEGGTFYHRFSMSISFPHLFIYVSSIGDEVVYTICICSNYRLWCLHPTIPLL